MPEMFTSCLRGRIKLAVTGNVEIIESNAFGDF